MSLKRLDELKQLLLGPEHEPNPVLNNIVFRKDVVDETPEIIEISHEQSVIIESPTDQEPPEKIAKFDLNKSETEENLTVEDIEKILDSNPSPRIVEEKICPFMLNNKKSINLCLLIIENNQDLLMSKLIIPWIDKFTLQDLPKDIIETLSAKSQKILLENILQKFQNEWKFVENLQKIDLEDGQVQMYLAEMIIKQGDNKDNALGKMMINLIKKLPRKLDANIYDMWLQAVAMHGTFLSKMCSLELKKIKPSN